jgi:hypothetical protein
MVKSLPFRKSVDCTTGTHGVQRDGRHQNLPSWFAATGLRVVINQPFFVDLVDRMSWPLDPKTGDEIA